MRTAWFLIYTVQLIMIAVIFVINGYALKNVYDGYKVMSGFVIVNGCSDDLTVYREDETKAAIAK